MGLEIAIGLGLLTGAMTGFSNYSSQKQQIAQQQNQLTMQSISATSQANQSAYEAGISRLNSQALLNQSEVSSTIEKEIAGKKLELEQHNIHQEKEEIRRNYNFEKGNNISLLAGSNVEITSGSALDALIGNAGYFASDTASNTYKKLMADWNTKQDIKKIGLNAQANAFQAKLMGLEAGFKDTQAKTYSGFSSLYKDYASSLNPSLLQSVLSGTSTGLSTFGMAGGLNYLKKK